MFKYLCAIVIVGPFEPVCDQISYNSGIRATDKFRGFDSKSLVFVSGKENSV